MNSFKINGYEVKPSTQWPNYAATRCGKIFRIDTQKEMKQYPTGRSGYLNFRACHNNKPSSVCAHKCIADAWLYNDDTEHKTQVNHKDGNKINNCVDNLEWCTPSQNSRHAVREGLIKSGEELYNSELSDTAAHLICQELETGADVTYLANKYAVSKDIIRKLRAGDTYFHIRVLYTVPHIYKNELSERTIRWICENIIKGVSDKQIANISTNDKVTTAEVKRIRRKIRYSSISNEYF